MTERHTGLCTYSLRLGSGELIYDPDAKTTGFSTESAYLWLWQPESVPERVAELCKRLPWIGAAHAVRAR